VTSLCANIKLSLEIHYHLQMAAQMSFTMIRAFHKLVRTMDHGRRCYGSGGARVLEQGGGHFFSVGCQIYHIMGRLYVAPPWGASI